MGQTVVEVAAQLGHNPTVCLDTYAHVMAEERDGEHVSAEEQIFQARAALNNRDVRGGAAQLRRTRTVILQVERAANSTAHSDWPPHGLARYGLASGEISDVAEIAFRARRVGEVRKT